jgi:hypothetical protein
MIYIGIDNGVSGSIGTIRDTDNTVLFSRTPVSKRLDYTKKKSWCNRIEIGSLTEMLRWGLDTNVATCIIERPMVNPMRWIATKSALRALEATLIVLEDLEIPYRFIDSKEWQKALLPSGLKGPELKLAAVEVAKRLYPTIDCGKDADGLLIAHYAKMIGEK